MVWVCVCVWRKQLDLTRAWIDWGKKRHCDVLSGGERSRCLGILILELMNSRLPYFMNTILR